MGNSGVSSGWQRARLWEEKRAHTEGEKVGEPTHGRSRLREEPTGFSHQTQQSETRQTLDAVYRCGVALLVVQGTEEGGWRVGTRVAC